MDKNLVKNLWNLEILKNSDTVDPWFTLFFLQTKCSKLFQNPVRRRAFSTTGPLIILYIAWFLHLCNALFL